MKLPRLLPIDLIITSLCPAQQQPCILFSSGLNRLGIIFRNRTKMPSAKSSYSTSPPPLVKVSSLPPVDSTLVNTDHHVNSPPTAFENPWSSFQKVSLSTIFWTRFGTHPEKNFVPVPEGPNGTRSEELVKVVKPDWGSSNLDSLRATWLGHASFLVETPVLPGCERGLRILFDPVFSERTSPFSFAGPKRYTPTPCTLDELPDVDIVCISHNHYDHLDITTIKALRRRHGAALKFFAPLGNKAWFITNAPCEASEAIECDWWQSNLIEAPGRGTVKLTCCPAQHNSGRSISDHGTTLWSSWALECMTPSPTDQAETQRGKTFFFAGDTAYQSPHCPDPCPVFTQIGNTFGPFDLALLPIGLMTPASFMGSFHATPEQSLQIHQDIKSKLSIGMHYGTVRGGISARYEDVRDPPRRWRVAGEKADVWCGGGVEGGGDARSPEGVGLCHVGETVCV
ncbi:Hypothetical protein R9X50_00493700 [Acrodontium crateriforme]|uniref:Metallo-beta-lactamase domain-containing protein n=1 Tax=Acrodontium crateriforme TaxID=150365 RepID=A0AAQ3M547_9PEZI|nr:Hypothetical protein R9X50_00493700 [Acrodontium crateriforme]